MISANAPRKQGKESDTSKWLRVAQGILKYNGLRTPISHEVQPVYLVSLSRMSGA